ncbi:zinc-finger domain-containing protein [Geranomyces variabilis]|nr:zinc-finger domain-containing protein [Geranomyces variabilis]KAJ3139852.1 hypothetical protein HDU90_008750 [Geranomyces variabilis]
MLAAIRSFVPRAISASTAAPRFMSNAAAAANAGSQAVVAQAPNRPAVWSEHQQNKAVAMTGARFEQTDFDLQVRSVVDEEKHLRELEAEEDRSRAFRNGDELRPNPLSAQELISQVPVRMVSARRVACDGGGGALGHPKVYINLDRGEPQPCGYCGLRFQQEHHHH